MFLLQLALDQGYATGPDDRKDWIPMILLKGVTGVTCTEGALTVSFSSPDAAKEAHDRTGWPSADSFERTLQISTVGNHITALPPPFSDCITAFYARWFIQPDRSPPFGH